MQIYQKTRLITSPCKRELLKLQNKISLLEQDTVTQSLIDHISDVLNECSHLDVTL